MSNLQSYICALSVSTKVAQKITCEQGTVTVPLVVFLSRLLEYVDFSRDTSAPRDLKEAFLNVCHMAQDITQCEDEIRSNLQAAPRQLLRDGVPGVLLTSINTQMAQARAQAQADYVRALDEANRLNRPAPVPDITPESE